MGLVGPPESKCSFCLQVMQMMMHDMPCCCVCVRYDFVIVSYDMLVDVKDVLMAVDFKVVILDESHCIKSSQVGQPHG